jgi:two-component system copper resistance phosphate regulon response regulator CusR
MVVHKYGEELRDMNILVVEDEPKVSKPLYEGLKADGYEVTLVQTGEDGFFIAKSSCFDLIVLDVMLPGSNGIEVLKTLRRQGLQVPVLLLSAKDAVEDRVLGLDAGADDYLVKPFPFPELCARIRALLRRSKTESVLSLRIGTLEMDLTTRSVTRDGKIIKLTLREFELLAFLLRHKGKVVSREMLARNIWKETGRTTPLGNVIDVHIAALRRKVDDEFEPKLVRTVRGVGFVLFEDERRCVVSHNSACALDSVVRSRQESKRARGRRASRA